MAMTGVINGNSHTAPSNETLYCSNLPDKLPKDELKRALYMLMITYGPILDVVALKTSKMRGQAHVLFRDKDASTQAMRALQNFEFFGKQMHISYAKTKSDTLAKLDGTYKQPEAASNATAAQKSVFGGAAVNGSLQAPPGTNAASAPASTTPEPRGAKRTREESGDEKEAEDSDGDAPMDMDDDDAPMDESSGSDD